MHRSGRVASSSAGAVAPRDAAECAAASGEGEGGEVGRVVAVAGCRWSAAAGVGRRLGDGVGRVGTGGGLDRDYVGHATGVQAEAELGDVAVASVRDDGPLSQAPAAAALVPGDLVEHIQGQSPFLPMPHLIGNLATVPDAA